MLQRGDTFGSYRIVARLKAGGMAQLYLARREGAAGFSRPVALKVIHAHLARQDEFVRMFVDEATLSSKIHDPNVVHVEDLGSFGGTLFLAMEYVHGASLAHVLRAARLANRRLAPGLVAHVGAQVASGLHAAHETTDETGRPLGIVHRDVSPHNVLVAFKGHVKLIDFGVAKAYGQQHETHAGAIQGKVGYMPPEQARSEPIDRRADVYALGIVLWEMLAGRRLFDAENELALIERVRNPNVEPPSRFAPGIPPALDDVVMRMLARSPDARPATALDVKRMLLDAVPDARSVEAHDVAALLRALLPGEIEQQDKTLATVDELASTPVFAASAAHDADEDTTTTEKRIDPVEALHQLTVPAFVAPPPEPPRRASTGAIAFLITGLAGIVVVVAVLVKVRAPAAAPAPVPAPEPVPVAAEPTPAPATAAAEPSSVVEPAPVVVATTPARPIATTIAKPAPRPRAKPSAGASAPKPRCVFVEGVELCDH